MINRKVFVATLAVLFLTAGAFAADTAEKKTDPASLFFWTILCSLAALTIAAIAGIAGQSKAFCSASDNIGRNPAAAGPIRALLILALVLMESLVIYVLLIDLILYFIKWGQYTVK